MLVTPTRCKSDTSCELDMPNKIITGKRGEDKFIRLHRSSLKEQIHDV